MSWLRRCAAGLIAGTALVVVTPVVADAAAPPRLSIVSAPATVAAGETLVVRWRVQAEAGVGQYGDVDGVRPGTWAKLGGPQGWISWCGFPLRTQFESGSDVDAIYSIACRIPDVVPNGSYSLYLSGFDRDGVHAAEEQVTFQVVGGSADGGVPRISDVAVESPAVPGRELTLTWRATDETGVASVIPWAFGPNGRLTDDAGMLWLGFASGSLVSGTDRDGRYSVSLPLSATAVGGTYTVWFSVVDVVGNREATLGPSGPGSVYATFTVGGPDATVGSPPPVAGGAAGGQSGPGADGATPTDGAGTVGGVTATTIPGRADAGSTGSASGSDGSDDSIVTRLVSATRVGESPEFVGVVAVLLGLVALARVGLTRRRRRTSTS
ncbi:MAG: hypothetical protein FGM58_06085 [Acidimicrobiia bacterium]|nr:hypothetical protein [Acidimicrobiia bacterium]